MRMNDLPAAAQRTGHGHAVAEAPRKVLVFRVGAEEYAIDIRRVQEIRGCGAPTRIADAPPFILGVVDLRGVIVPIVDLRIRFGLAEAAYDGATVTIVLNVANRVVGVVVDSVSDVVQLEAQQIRDAPAFDAAVDARCIAGLATLGSGGAGRPLILIDIEALLSRAQRGLDAPSADVH